MGLTPADISANEDLKRDPDRIRAAAGGPARLSQRSNLHMAATPISARHIAKAGAEYSIRPAPTFCRFRYIVPTPSELLLGFGVLRIEIGTT